MRRYIVIYRTPRYYDSVSIVARSFSEAVETSLLFGQASKAEIVGIYFDSEFVRSVISYITKD